MSARGAFEEFERAVIEPVHRFWRDHDQRWLEASSAVLEELIDQLPETTPPATSQVVVVSGWTSRRHGYRLTSRVLAAANPGYRVRLTRHDRPDAPRSRRLDGLRLGFHVEAEAPLDAPLFRFGLGSSRGGLTVLPGSSPESVLAMADFIPESSPDQEHPPRGNVDNIQHYPQYASDRAASWFSALVHRNPVEIIELAERDDRMAQLAAAAMRTFDSAPRWAARMSLVASGRDATESADFTAVGVRRVEASVPRANGGTVPDLVPDGNLLRAVVGERPMPVPSSAWLHLTDAVVQNGGTVLHDGDLVVYERSADPVLDIVAGQSPTVFGSVAHPEAALVLENPPADEVITEGILLAGRNDFNWFHWLIEYLPRVLAVDDSIDPAVPVLVTNRTPSTGIQALEALTTRPIAVLDADLAYRVGTLHVMPPQVQVVDSTRIPWAEGLSLNPDALAALRRAWGVDSRSDEPARRIFLHRSSSHRGVVNQDELVVVARELGLEVIDPIDLSWDEQRDLFASAKLLVGASGAVMANYLLLRADARVLALTSAALSDFVLPAALAQAAGATFTYLVGPSASELSDHDVRNAWLHSDFSIDVEDFRSAVSDELARL